MLGKIGGAVIFLLLSQPQLRAQHTCNCKNDFGITCDTTIIKNKGLLLRTCRADSIYYHFLDLSSTKLVLITAYQMELGGYDYRLGALMHKVTKSAITFRYGCAATGPCLYKTYYFKTGWIKDGE